MFSQANSNRKLKQRRRRRRQQELQKGNRFRLVKQQLCKCITLFCTFLCRLCTTTRWKCLNSCFVEDRNTRQQLSFSFPELWHSPLEFNSKTFANPWRIKRDGTSAIKFEAARIHFLSDVFVAVAVVVAVRWPIFNDWNPISQEAVFSEVSLFCVWVWLFLLLLLFCFFLLLLFFVFFSSIFIQGHPIRQI